MYINIKNRIINGSTVIPQLNIKLLLLFGEETMCIDKRYCHNGMENQCHVRGGYDYDMTRQHRNQSCRIDLIQIETH